MPLSDIMSAGGSCQECWFAVFQQLEQQQCDVYIVAMNGLGNGCAASDFAWWELADFCIISMMQQL